MQRIDTNAATLIVLRQLGACKGQLEGADADYIAHFQLLILYLLRIDIDVIGAIQINDAIALLVANQTCVMGGNLGMIENDLVIWQATHSDEGIVQGNG